METDYALGIDFGTSGVRAIAIDATGQIQATARVPMTMTSPGLAQQWHQGLHQVLTDLPKSVRQRLGAIAVNGTSGTVLLCDAQGQPVTEPLLYNDDRGQDSVAQLRAIAPAGHPVLSATSSLAKVLWWVAQGCPRPPCYLLHQADWLGFLLHGQLGLSDYHNALKLGYDVAGDRYPAWFQAVPLHGIKLPRVLVPGQGVGPIQGAIAAMLSIPATCVVCAGTTDSIAAFLASGATQVGQAVTSLGSTLVIKLLSQTRVDWAAQGIYSHRFGDRWLVGGASNTGGAVLRQYFTEAAIERLSGSIDLTVPSGLDYYPLLRPGERFPIADPALPPRLTPRPQEDHQFLYGVLEGMARIEALGYQRLEELGASRLTQVWTAGGGAQNPVWTALRDRLLPVPVGPAPQTEAAYGTARLAQQRGIERQSV
jgi:sugar (pentulose or hexulose) kinase